jgi:hypothetical protein
MPSLYLAGDLPDQYELSRHAAERYALLTAIKEQRARNRRSSRPLRGVEAARRPLATHS